MILLSLWVLAVPSQALAGDGLVQRQHHDISLGELLDDNGRVVIPEGFSGSIDPSGFQMVSKGDEAPQFVSSGTSNDFWSEGEFGIPGCNEIVHAATVVNGELFLGGAFSACGSATAFGIARFDPTTGEFAALGSGVSGTVYAMTAIGDRLYVGGFITAAGGQPARRIAVFDTTQTGNTGWSALGDGVDSDVRALAAIGDKLYVGGLFDEAGGVFARYIAVFDTTQSGNAGWSALGDGVNDFVFALAAIGDDLYVGGSFAFIGGPAGANSIAAYDTTQTGNAGWRNLGDGVNGVVYALTAIGDDLYVGGDFNFAGGDPANRIAVLDTTQTGFAGWSALGSGAGGTVRALATIGDQLYVAGTTFISVFDTNTTGWSSLGNGVSNPVRALAAIGDELYVGGSFSQIGSEPASYVAVYDTTQTGDAGWSAVAGGLNNRVRALAAIGDDLYVGGSFTQAGGTPANYVAVYDTTQTGNAGWSALGDGVNHNVHALAAVGDKLYVGGRFDEAGGVFASYIAVFDTTQTGNAGWSALGDGVDGFVYALTASGNDLYVGGPYNQAGGAPASRIAVFDTTQTGNAGWSALGDGVDGTVYALTASGNDLYVGGSYNQAGGAPASSIAVYDTTQTGNAGWSTFGDGVGTSVRALAVVGDNLYVGGTFAELFGAPTNYLAVYDTTQTGNAGWSELGDGVDGFVYALAAIGDQLYVGGSYDQAGGAPASRIAVYDTTQTGNAGWATLGSGAIANVDTIVAIGGNLFVGGPFTRVGGKVNAHLARYTFPDAPPQAHPITVATDKDTPITITLTGSDINDEALTFSIATGPANGSLDGIMPIDDVTAEVTYTPNADFNGNDSFTFSVNDGSVDSSEATINVIVGLFADSFEQNE